MIEASHLQSLGLTFSSGAQSRGPWDYSLILISMPNGGSRLKELARYGDRTEAHGWLYLTVGCSGTLNCKTLVTTTVSLSVQPRLTDEGRMCIQLGVLLQHLIM